MARNVRFQLWEVYRERDSCGGCGGGRRDLWQLHSTLSMSTMQRDPTGRNLDGGADDPQSQCGAEGTPARARRPAWVFDEAEVRDILRDTLNQPERPAVNLYQRIRSPFAPLGGVDLELPPREPAPEPPRFD